MEPANMEHVVHALHQQVQALQAQVAQQAAAPAPAPAPAAPAHASRLKPVKPDSFTGSGKDGYDIEEWLFSLSNYMAAAGDQATDRERIAFAGGLLKGDAAVWYRNEHPLMLEPGYTFEDFTDDMRAEFADVNSVTHARKRLDALKQTGSVRRYNTAFRNLLLRIPDLSAGDAKHRYIQGLKPEIVREVEVKKPDTLRDAMALADTLDTVGQPVENRHGRPGREAFGARRAAAYGPAPMELGAFRAAPGRYAAPLPRRLPPAAGPARPGGNRSPQRTRLTPEEREHLIANGGCVYCRKMGHTVDQCRARPSNPANFARPSLQQGNGFRRGA
jgi:hypothetical protein